MNSSIIQTAHLPCSYCSCSAIRTGRSNSSSLFNTQSFRRGNARKTKTFLKCLSLRGGGGGDFGSSVSSSIFSGRNPSSPETEVTGRLLRVVSEFNSLAEPLERVKRLLEYASRLPPYDESGRVAENRVAGCATQVWVVVEIGDDGRMRFRADSDSEISKGFCSCLIWILDGAEPEEVLELKMEDFESVNVGLHGKGHSRVNTWHNILITMQKKTRALVAERNGKPPLEQPLASIHVSPPPSDENPSRNSAQDHIYSRIVTSYVQY